jgi:hypothetical protein
MIQYINRAWQGIRSNATRPVMKCSDPHRLSDASAGLPRSGCLTTGTKSGQFDRPLVEGKAQPLSQALGRSSNPLVLSLYNGTALAADEELDGVGMVGMLTRHERPGRLQPMDNPVLKQKVEAPVYAGCGHRRVLRTQDVPDLISG